jgi:hypothetical protein
MANPYYNPGANHSDYAQGHTLPQSPFTQAHPSTAGTTPTGHLPVYSHSPYAVHSLPPHAHTSYSQGNDHSVLQYSSAIHPSTQRWVGPLETEDALLKYRQDDPDDDYEMDHQSQDHRTTHLQQQMQAQNVSHESQPHAQLQAHPPMASVPQQQEQMSPANPAVSLRTGKAPQLHLEHMLIHLSCRSKRTSTGKQEQAALKAQIVSLRAQGRWGISLYAPYLIDRRKTSF